MIAALLGFTFLIAGFGVSYNFDYGTFLVKSNEVKAELAPDDNWKSNGQRFNGICEWRPFNRYCVVH